MNKFVFYLSFLFFSCEDNGGLIPLQNSSPIIEVLDKDRSIELNKNWSKDESFKIDAYCKRQGWIMTKTASGIFYSIVKKGNGVVFPSVEDEVTIDYEVRLLDVNQTICYSSEEYGTAVFKVEKSLVESGLHEAITYLNVGDSAVVVLPHFLAHGIAGNVDKIPPLSPVLYYLSVVDVKN